MGLSKNLSKKNLSVTYYLFKILNKMPPGLIKKIRQIKVEGISHYLRFLITGKVPMPRSVTIDPSNICNLKCPLCPTGTGKLRQKKEFLTLNLYKKILKDIPSIKKVSLFNWGETFHNPEILEILRYTKKKGIFSIVHSNLNWNKDEAFFDDLVRSGLDRISISLDGVSSETYSKYRIGGDFDLVLRNLDSLINSRNKSKNKDFQISLQFIVNKYNEKEYEETVEMSKRMGILFSPVNMDLYEDLPDYSNEDDLNVLKKKWLPQKRDFVEQKYLQKKKRSSRRLFCDFLFSRPAITPDGNVYPCCALTDEKNSFGNINEKPFEEIWNNELFNSARDLFKLGKKDLSSIKTICHHCHWYQ